MLSLARFRAVLALPDVRQAFVSSFVGRVPIGIAGLAILLLVQADGGSYAQAGATGAAYVAGLGMASPVLGRLIDRIGPRRVLFGCAAVYPAALVALVLSVQHHAPAAATLALAGLAGASFPPVTACQRAWLRQQFGDHALLTAALSLDALIVELVFIGGPLLVALLVALISPAAAVIAAAVCGLAGSLQFVRARALRTWRMTAGFTGAILGPLAEPGFAALLALVTSYATVFGLVEIGVAAYAAEAGSPAMAGVLLSVMSVGSAAGALAYGGRHWRLPLSRQFSWSLALTGIGILPLAAITEPAPFAIGCAVAYALTRRGERDVLLLEKSQLTNGCTWHAAGLVGQLRGRKNLTRMMQNSVAVFDRLEKETEQAISWRKVGSIPPWSSAERSMRWEVTHGWGGAICWSGI